MHTFHFRAMHTNIYLNAEGDQAQVQQGFIAAQQFIHASEQRFTRFSEESELSQLNRSAGHWFQASADMVFVVALARQYAEQTRGLFDPSILPDLLRIGYDRTLDFVHADAAARLAPIHTARNLNPLKDVIVNPEENLICLPAGMQLDLGGIAKGWIAEQAALILGEYSTACCVNAGGDMALFGLPEGQRAWPVDLENPLHLGETLATLNVPAGAVATSSTTKRKWTQGDQLRHHLIDPRTGEPAQSEWISVTVIAPHADTCEVFAKALLIAGPREAQAVMENISGIYYLAMDRAGQIWANKESMDYVNAE